jgi:hypothetical protein
MSALFREAASPFQALVFQSHLSLLITEQRLVILVINVGTAIVEQVGCLNHLEISETKGEKTQLISVDLKNVNGKITLCKEGTPICALLLNVDSMILVGGTVDARSPAHRYP